jgi:hypothetical protein
MATTYTKHELVELLTRLSDDFFQAAGKTENDAQHKSYRAGMADGFNIARQLAANLAVEQPKAEQPKTGAEHAAAGPGVLEARRVTPTAFIWPKGSE